MITNKKEFTLGAGLMAAFLAVLAVIFMPVFGGHNGLNYLDALYNSISKGSAYYIPKVQAEAADYNEKAVMVTLDLSSEQTAQQTAALFNQSGAMVNVSGKQLKVSGDLGAILKNCLEDADHMYGNDGKFLESKYGYGARQIMYNWWSALKGMEKDLTDQKAFKDARIISIVMSKAVETAYNYFGIEAQKIADKAGIVLFSLAFYVIYTLWYGYAIMFMMEGVGLNLEH